MKRFSLVMVMMFAGVAVAQPEPAKPEGPEFDALKKSVGKWDMTMKMQGQEFKGTGDYKMGVGGLWLVSDVEIDMGGMKFVGHGMDTYNAKEKKFVGVWLDSMTPSAMNTEGSYDAATKTLTMSGEAPGPDGKPAKFTNKIKWKDDDHYTFAMYQGDAKEPEFTIEYARKK